MKKALLVVLLICVAFTSVLAGDLKYLFTDLDQHVEILNGFLPTLLGMGASFEGLALVEDQLTQLQAYAAGGYTQRKAYQNPLDGSVLSQDFLVFDLWQARLTLKFLQGFGGKSEISSKDLLTAYAGYEGRWEMPVDSMVAGLQRLNGIMVTVPTIDLWTADSQAAAGSVRNSAIYPELAAPSIFASTFFGGLKLNMMQDDGVTSNGLSVDLSLKATFPAISTNSLSFWSANLNVVGGYTIFQLQSLGKDPQNIFSVVAVDRFCVNYTDGDAVPAFIQGSVSLGRKVRGFNSNTYNTNFTVVNNLDIRLSGPDRMLSFLDGIFPRINLFFDMGFNSGKLFNCNVENSYFLCSTGVQVTVSFMDFIDLGLQCAYLIKGTNLVNPDSNIQMGATFFLDF
jgi:hypothetical protein